MIRCKTTMVLGRKGAKVLRMKISEMITDRYKLRLPPTVYYDLLADVQELEEEQEPTAKNDLAVDKLLAGCEKMSFEIEIFNKPLRVVALDAVKNIVKGLPSVTPQEPQSFEWCETCKEYDQEKHCCHRWTKVIRNTVEELKQEYIEREVLDKIYADIQKLRGCSCSCSDGIIDDVEDILDKYKAESEPQESEDKE